MASCAAAQLRARIAAKEADESKQDQAYQDIMQQAERSFQEGRYEVALSQYEKARALRPFNVFPKVKIEDLRALIAGKQPPVPEPEVVEEHPVDHEDTGSGALRVVEPPPAPPTPKVQEPVERVEAPREVEAMPKVKKADMHLERRYKEGHAFVIERVVTLDGRVVVYKRVYHQWGQVYYFEDGVSVDERVWKARFPN